MFLVVRRVVLGYNWTLEATLSARGPKSPKKRRKKSKNEDPRMLFGALWAPIVPPGGV